jgi:two-component system, NarL family, response regulator NreC
MDSVTIRVILADDHMVVRTGLRSLLRTDPQISVIGEASTGRQAVALAERFRPDVVVMDLGMADLDGVEATRQISARVPQARVLVLTMHGEDEYLVAALQAGASGYLVKSIAEQELHTAVRAVARGEVYVQPTAASVLARQVVGHSMGPEDRLQLQRLTARERDVLRLVAEGLSAPDIGRQLTISAKTVDTYKQRIHEKVGIVGRPEYVRFALRLGLLAAKPATLG